MRMDRKVRLLLVRHAQSANKRRAEGQAASRDPGLSELGHKQAEALAPCFIDKLRHGLEEQTVLLVSSPMRRCLLTARPTVRALLKEGLPPGDVLCHGGCYEYSCAGLDYGGSGVGDIAAEFPEFTPVAFSASGFWDYQGNSDKENEPECRDRARRIADWLYGNAAPQLCSRTVGRCAPATRHGEAATIVLVTHQTVADALCQVLVDGTAENWEYGDITYKLRNAGITEVFLYPGGDAAFGGKNDGMHLLGLGGR